MLCNVDCNKNVRSAIGIVFFLFANVVGLHWFCKISNPASAKIILIFGNDNFMFAIWTSHSKDCIVENLNSSFEEMYYDLINDVCS